MQGIDEKLGPQRGGQKRVDFSVVELGNPGDLALLGDEQHERRRAVHPQNAIDQPHCGERLGAAIDEQHGTNRGIEPSDVFERGLGLTDPQHSRVPSVEEFANLAGEQAVRGHDQHRTVGGIRSDCGRRRVLGEGELNSEPGLSDSNRIDTDTAAHQPQDAPGEGQPERVMGGGSKWVDHGRHFGRDGIGAAVDRQDQRYPFSLAGRRRHSDTHRAGIGSRDRVIDEIAQHALDRLAPAANPRRQIRVDTPAQHNALGGRRMAPRRQRIVEQRVQIESLGARREGSGFDGRQGEKIADRV